MKSCAVVVFLMILSILTGCSNISKEHLANEKYVKQLFNKAIETQAASKKQETVSLNKSVAQVLYPTSSAAANKKSVTFDVNVKNMDINEFFHTFMSNLGESVVVQPGLVMKISLKLNNTTLEGVISALQDMYNIQVAKTNYGYKVTPPRLITQLFVLNYLNLKRTSSSLTNLTDRSSGGSSSTSTKATGFEVTSTTSNDKFWDNTANTIRAMVGLGAVASSSGKRKRRTRRSRKAKGAATGQLVKQQKPSVQANPDTGVIIVTTTPQKMKRVAKFIHYTQSIMNRQVMIEAKLVEIQLSKGFETGIDWNNLGFSMAGGTGTYTMKPGTDKFALTNLQATIRLLRNEGKVTVLSSPRVVTMNNQQALLEVGSTEYFVTDVKSGTTPVGQTATVTSDVTMSPFFSGISLAVLPQINQSGDITLYIHPSVTQVSASTTEVTLSSSQKLSLPTAKSDIRETDSLVRVRSGEVVVLGGLMQSKTITDRKGLPWFSSTINTQHDDSSSVTELVILLRATIPNKKEWTHQLKEYSEHYKKLANAVES